MAKKKKSVSSDQSSVISDQSSVISDQSSVINDQSSVTNGQPPVSEATEKLYTVGLWANLPQYVCQKCGFDTLNAGTMQEHLFWQHSVIVEIEGADSSTPPPTPPQIEEHDLERGDDEEVFEVELEETGSTVDEQGNEHKTFTVKE